MAGLLASPTWTLFGISGRGLQFLLFALHTFSRSVDAQPLCPISHEQAVLLHPELLPSSFVLPPSLLLLSSELLYIIGLHSYFI